MSTATITNRASCLGKTFEKDVSVASDGAVVNDPTLGAAKTGTLTTRTDNDTGTVTMASGHGFATSDKIDLYWTGGSRTRMTATVTGDSVVLDGGTGDNLPIATTAVTAMKPQNEAFAVGYAVMQALLCSCTVPATVTFLDGSAAVVATVRITTTADYIWDSANGADNPFGTTDVATAALSHGFSGGSKQVNAVALVN